MERYLSPNDGRMQQINFPWFSGLFATSKAAKAAAPEEIPLISPSSSASFLAVPIASSLLTWIISFTKDKSQFLGTKPAPIPYILWGPGFPPDKTGDSAGSTAIVIIFGFLDLRY